MIVSTPVAEFTSGRIGNNNHISHETSKSEKISQSEKNENSNKFPFDLNVNNTPVCNTLQPASQNSIIVCIFPHASSPSSPTSTLSSSSSSPSSVTSYALIPLSLASSFPSAASPSVVVPSSSLSSSSLPPSSFSSSFPSTAFSSSFPSTSFASPPSSFSSSFPLTSSFPSFSQLHPSFASSKSSSLLPYSSSPSGVSPFTTVFSSSVLPTVVSSSSPCRPVVHSYLSSVPVSVSSSSFPNRTVAPLVPTYVTPCQWRALSKQNKHSLMRAPTSEFVDPVEYLRTLCKNLECLGIRPPFPSREHFCCSKCKYRKGNVCKAKAETRLRTTKVRVRREFEVRVRGGKRRLSEVEARRREMSGMIDADGE